MTFDYNPITGLNYYSETPIVFDMRCIPALDPIAMGKYVELIKNQGVQAINSKEETDTPELLITKDLIYSNVPYEVFRERLE